MPGAVVLLTGRSFSGKSTLASALEEGLPAALVGYDAINAERGLRGGSGIAIEEWLRTGRTAHDRAGALLSEGRTVVVEDTASPRFLRDEWRGLARAADAGFLLVHVDAAADTVRQRWLANRAAATRSDVEDAVMAAHLAAFEPPAPDEPHLRVDGDGPYGSERVAAVRTALEAAGRRRT